MNADLISDMVNEVKQKIILHWNYRGLTEIPEQIRGVTNSVQEIYLKYNELKRLPDWISDFSNVTNLYLYCNYMDDLPVSLGQMDKLTVLDLSLNQLNELPSCLGCLKNLQSLILNQNLITSLPQSMSQLENLECLCLSGNKIVALPEWLGSLPNLKELFVDNNLLKEIPNRLTISNSLSFLSVCANQLTYLPLNAFLSNPYIRFDSNTFLNYLSLPVLYQLISKFEYRLNQESGNVVAYGCFRSRNKTRERNINMTLTLVPENSYNDLKQIIIELPRQLLIVHDVHENKVLSLSELSLRKVYLNRFHHVLDISSDPLNVNVERQRKSNKIICDIEECSKSFIPYNLILNGPVSICVNNACNEAIFTEAWILFGIRRDTFVIPTIVILCSQKCAAQFVKSSNFTENYEMYVIRS